MGGGGEDKVVISTVHSCQPVSGRSDIPIRMYRNRRNGNFGLLEPPNKFFKRSSFFHGTHGNSLKFTKEVCMSEGEYKKAINKQPQ